MNNYKIKVNGATTKEAQILLEKLGYTTGTGFGLNHAVWLFAESNGTVNYSSTEDFISDIDYQELTLPQLRDLVVLHRNDVNDANFKLFISPSQGCLSLYKASDDVFYAYAEKSKCWDKSRSVGIKNKDLEPIQASKEDEQGLISGAYALRALADGKEVELRDKENNWVRANNHHLVGLFLGNAFDFRLKPRTITLNVGIPAPFEPKVGDVVWCLSELSEKGYEARTAYDAEDFIPHIAYWRTEEEIKQVVVALRGGIKG
ncbi:hypothetical protein [Acinetobacter venetianus]|uniref:Uncharacterized protein n=1 Tax=Acinetobacter venetianus TaxID=52133 RepID=A0A150HU45_9GAMM|nr:hypothetical protein [Acinetobacter venetianus]KXZ70368.1 hypothetical protein AVENLUH13518_01852 [Acinetobacter venetianus]